MPIHVIYPSTDGLSCFLSKGISLMNRWRTGAITTAAAEMIKTSGNILIMAGIIAILAASVIEGFYFMRMAHNFFELK